MFGRPQVKNENSDGARSTGENLAVTGSSAAEGLPSGLGTRRVEPPPRISLLLLRTREEQMSQSRHFEGILKYEHSLNIADVVLSDMI